MRRACVVMGLDLSLSGAGVAVIRTDWNCDMNNVHVYRFGYGLHSKDTNGQIQRLAYLRDQILDVAKIENVTHVFVEDYAFSMNFRAHQMGEVGGVIRLACYERGLPIVAVACNTARKTFFGEGERLKGKEAKQFIKSSLEKLGVSWSSRKTEFDREDAFVIANHGLALLHSKHITIVRSQSRRKRGKSKAV